jgi:citronellol/citronellal dehydrogenase
LSERSLCGFSILYRPAEENTGNFYIDDEVLAEESMTHHSNYAASGVTDLHTDIFLDS